MSRRLVAYVHVAGRVFAPGDDVPDEYAEKITNPAAWDEASFDEGGELPSGTVSAQNGTGGREDVTAEPPTEPPRSGKGSGRDAWVAFASSRGVAMPEDMTRDDIVADLVSQGIITPGE